MDNKYTNNQMIKEIKPEFEFWGTGIIVINNKKEILLGLRMDTKNWGLPGGRLENNETPLEGITREVKEETGLQYGIDFDKIEVLSYQEVPLEGEIKNAGFKKHMDFTFLCYKKSDSIEIPQPEEVVELKWVSKKDVCDLLDKGTNIGGLFKYSVDSIKELLKTNIL